MEVSISGLKEVRQLLYNVGGYAEHTYDWGKVVGNEAATGIRDATSTWKRPTFVSVRTQGGVGSSGAMGRSASINVEVDSPSYQFVDKGTTAHFIAPKGNYPLAFNSKFSAKSRPGRLRAYVGFSGPPKRFAWLVWHPGNQARRFSDLAAARGLREGIKRITADLQKMIANRGKAVYYSGPGWGK